jgi:hypothetical protein
MQASPVEIQAHTHWNLISHSMTTPLPVLWPSIVLLPSLNVLSFPQGEAWYAFKKVFIQFSFLFMCVFV